MPDPNIEPVVPGVTPGVTPGVDPTVIPVVPAVTPVVDPAVTPVVAPAAPVVPVVIPDPPAIPAPEPSGSAYFDTVQKALYEKGIDYTKYTAQVMETGKVTPEHRAELVTALGETQVQLLEHGIETERTRIHTAQAAEANRIYASINLPGQPDGKAAFETIAEWSKTGVTDAERSSLNTMLAQGGVQADLAIKALKEKYMADPNYTVAADLVSGAGISPTAGLELISRATYVKELRIAENARDKVAAEKLRARAKHTMATNMEAWRP